MRLSAGRKEACDIERSRNDSATLLVISVPICLTLQPMSRLMQRNVLWFFARLFLCRMQHQPLPCEHHALALNPNQLHDISDPRCHTVVPMCCASLQKFRVAPATIGFVTDGGIQGLGQHQLHDVSCWNRCLYFVSPPCSLVTVVSGESAHSTADVLRVATAPGNRTYHLDLAPRAVKRRSPEHLASRF